jgi:hypothetical protein
MWAPQPDPGGVRKATPNESEHRSDWRRMIRSIHKSSVERSNLPVAGSAGFILPPNFFS